MQFADALNILLVHEGGYSNVSYDTGGETYQGISRNNWPNWPGWQIIDQYKPLKHNQVIENVTLQNLVTNFYKVHFWDVIKADQLPKEIRPLVFDFAVNSGTGTAVMALQRVLRDSTGKKIAIDGVVGPQTIALANQLPAKQLFERYKQARYNFFVRIVERNPSQKKFLTGWLNRLNSYQFVGIAAGSVVLFSLFAYFALKGN